MHLLLLDGEMCFVVVVVLLASKTFVFGNADAETQLLCVLF